MTRTPPRKEMLLPIGLILLVGIGSWMWSIFGPKGLAGAAGSVVGLVLLVAALVHFIRVARRNHYM